MAHAAKLLGDKWTLLIVREALYGVTRFDAMHEDLGAPRTVLANRLKKLVEAGVLIRRPYKEEGQRMRHQYVLSQKGVELALPLMALMQWGDKHLRQAPPCVEIIERASGKVLQSGLVDGDGRRVDLSNTRVRIVA